MCLAGSKSLSGHIAKAVFAAGLGMELLHVVVTEFGEIKWGFNKSIAKGCNPASPPLHLLSCTVDSLSEPVWVPAHKGYRVALGSDTVS